MWLMHVPVWARGIRDHPDRRHKQLMSGPVLSARGGSKTLYVLLFFYNGETDIIASLTIVDKSCFHLVLSTS